jgi:hypothetical protein
VPRFGVRLYSLLTWPNIDDIFKLVLSFSGTCLRHVENTELVQHFNGETLEKEEN